MQIMKKHAIHGISAFELTQKTLNNLKHFNIGATAKNVLWYLTSCYNPENKYIFPKQKTIANVIGCSERSVIRAIQELVKEGLILVECNLTNKYVFTSKILGECPQNDNSSQGENLSENGDKISPQDDKLAPSLIEQTKEQINKPTNVEDFKILKDYAIKHGAKNVNAYINVLRKNGGAKKIMDDYKHSQANAKVMLNNTRKVLQDLKFAKENCAFVSNDYFTNVRSIICGQN